MSDIIYRFANTDDVELVYEFALHAIASSVIPVFAADVGEGLQERITEGNVRNLILAEDLDEGKIVGYAEVDRKHKSRILIMGVFVLPEYRRQGIGKRILQMILDEICTNHEDLYVRAFTDHGVKFWQSYGFDVEFHVMEYKNR